MPWAGVHATATAPVAGGAKVKVYGPAPEPPTLKAGRLLIRKSPASTPVTGSENSTEIWVSALTVEPRRGVMLATGGTVSGVE